MSEVWVAAAITVGGGVISGIGQEKKAKEDRKNANADRSAATREEALYGGILSSFERQQEDHYNQLDRQRKQRGLDTFRQFSTVNQFSPGFRDNSPGVVVPEQVSIANTIDKAVLEDQANQKAAQPQSEGGKKKSSLVKKIVDPLGLF